MVTTETEIKCSKYFKAQSKKYKEVEIMRVET